MEHNKEPFHPCSCIDKIRGKGGFVHAWTLWVCEQQWGEQGGQCFLRRQMHESELRRDRKKLKTYLAVATLYMVPICVSCGCVTWEGSGWGKLGDVPSERKRWWEVQGEQGWLVKKNIYFGNWTLSLPWSKKFKCFLIHHTSHLFPLMLCYITTMLAFQGESKKKTHSILHSTPTLHPLPLHLLYNPLALQISFSLALVVSPGCCFIPTPFSSKSAPSPFGPSTQLQQSSQQSPNMSPHVTYGLTNEVNGYMMLQVLVMLY